ncbi:MAG: carbonic anhydrase [Gammaproteobacteria bacterium]|nr:carbonic anhydrase [Gammaproteobacteria bacterium]MBU2677354.1 carbonic anhydrase [Gammaproteobacteria bacterium]NNL51085.1 carbonic anhydrase [Woeseiaceae bacterium]
MVSAKDALDELRDGNRRFVAGEFDAASIASRAHQAGMSGGQNPFAIILACSDSRVPVELVFDQGFGDLFVIRVAGNVVAPSQIGSIEFAASQFGTKLVVVLGHSNCGAVIAALKELALEQTHRSPNLRAIVDRVRPAIEPVLDAHKNSDTDTLTSAAVRANIIASVERLSHGSLILEQLINDDKLTVVGAEYSIETGEVDFFDGQ